MCDSLPSRTGRARLASPNVFAEDDTQTNAVQSKRDRRLGNKEQQVAAAAAVAMTSLQDRRAGAQYICVHPLGIPLARPVQLSLSAGAQSNPPDPTTLPDGLALCELVSSLR